MVRPTKFNEKEMIIMPTAKILFVYSNSILEAIAEELSNFRIDKRRHYVLVFDTETCNTDADEKGRLDFSCGLVYDCGWSVVDTAGNVYIERSFVNADIYNNMKYLMESAYYGWKLPRYEADLADGTRTLANTYTIRQAMIADMKAFGITEVCAHNARFDVTVLNSTVRWATKSKVRYWFPYGTIVWDTMKMSRDVIHQMPTYRQFCEEHELMAANGRLSTTAENLYRFITKNPDFVESHTGLEDVQIEREILWYCERQHKPMRRCLYDNPLPQNDPPTELQRQIMALARMGIL